MGPRLARKAEQLRHGNLHLRGNKERRGRGVGQIVQNCSIPRYPNQQFAANTLYCRPAMRAHHPSFKIRHLQSQRLVAAQKRQPRGVAGDADARALPGPVEVVHRVAQQGARRDEGGDGALPVLVQPRRAARQLHGAQVRKGHLLRVPGADDELRAAAGVVQGHLRHARARAEQPKRRQELLKPDPKLNLRRTQLEEVERLWWWVGCGCGVVAVFLLIIEAP